METERQRTISQVVRQAAWEQTAQLVVEALVPFVIAPEDTDWAGGLTVTESDALKQGFYENLESARSADEGYSEAVAISWGGKKGQFNRLRRLVGELDSDVALSVIGEGVIRMRGRTVAQRLRRLYEHFGSLDIYGLEVSGGVTIWEDKNNPGWWELTVVGRDWVDALRRVG